MPPRRRSARRREAESREESPTADAPSHLSSTSTLPAAAFSAVAARTDWPASARAGSAGLEERLLQQMTGERREAERGGGRTTIRARRSERSLPEGSLEWYGSGSLPSSAAAASSSAAALASVSSAAAPAAVPAPPTRFAQPLVNPLPRPFDIFAAEQELRARWAPVAEWRAPRTSAADAAASPAAAHSSRDRPFSSSPSSFSSSSASSSSVLRPGLPPHFNYDLMLGHATHLFRSCFNMEHILSKRMKQGSAQPAQAQPASAASHASAIKQEEGRAATASPASPPALPPCTVCFIDPFGSRMEEIVAPWQQLSSLLTHLQAYIPQHLKEWCQVGLMRSEASTVAKMAQGGMKTEQGDAKTQASSAAAWPSSAAAAASSAAAAASSSSSSALRSEAVEPLTLSLKHKTLADAKLVAYEEHASSPADTLFSPTSAPVQPIPASSGINGSPVTHFPSLVAYGNLTVLLRGFNSSPTSSSCSSSFSPPPPQSHSFSLQVFGLDSLSDVLLRVRSYALKHFGLDLGRTKLYAVKQSFSLPLQHVTSVESGSTDPPRALSEQLTIFSAQLADKEQVLLVEEAEPAPAPSSSSSPSIRLTVRTLTGKSLYVDAHLGASVLDVKSRIADQESIPVSQQRLLYQKETMEEARKLEEYGIREACELQLLLKLRDSFDSGFLQCGRAGVNPLTAHSQEAAAAVRQLMSWTVPPLSKLRPMDSSLLSSLLIQTRRLLSEVFALVHSQSIVGHSSRGQAWIDEAQLLKQCQDTQVQKQNGRNEPVVIGGEEESAPQPSALKRTISLVEDDEEGGRPAASEQEDVIDLTSMPDPEQPRSRAAAADDGEAEPHMIS